MGHDTTFRHCLDIEWKASLTDPVREALLTCGESPDLESIRKCFPATSGDAAFDPDEIEAIAGKLKTIPEVDLGHPLLDRSVKAGLASVDATFQGDHPKYGVKGYAEDCHDGFPPTIIAAVDALSAWGLSSRARQLFRYWILSFVREDGTIDYYGTSISEYGQLLHTAACLEERAGIEGWWSDCLGPLNRMVEYLLDLRASAERDDGLIVGSPEADERDQLGKYFHNSSWVAKGFYRWADLCERQGASPSTAVEAVRNTANAIEADTLDAIRGCWPKDADDWWLPPRVEPLERPRCLTGTREASYTNYRYWPELLSSGILPRGMANRIVDARLSAGGQFCGMTRFEGWLDDWPLADYLYGLWQLGRKRDFLLTLYGHVAYHQAEGHLTAYEQVTFPPGKEKAPYCLPCQLVAARAARLLTSA